jgi:UDP-N-acetylglucosamine 2-epimerase (non-hydrolysing)
MGPKKIIIIFGTRPEAIKMAPVVMEFRNRESLRRHIKTLVCVTAQHRQMLDQALNLFGIVPDFDLNVMSSNQDLFQLTTRVLNGVGNILAETNPDMVLVQGDTTTTFAAALAAYYRGIRVGHVEAGLRTNNKFSPFPEELNRHLTGVISDYHFAPTENARQNLIKENVSPAKIVITGNTVIDALLHTVKRLERDPSRCQQYKKKYDFIGSLDGESKMILVTGHRRENFGEGFNNICKALARLAEDNSNVDIIYPVHLNPHVQEPVYRIIGGKKNIHLLPPLDYEPFVFFLSKAHVVLTDSGGIQEEAPSLGKPVIVMRDTTERPEAVEAGTAKLVGTDTKQIVEETTCLLNDPIEYKKMSFAHNPYGDGLAAKRITDFIRDKIWE